MTRTLNKFYPKFQKLLRSLTQVLTWMEMQAEIIASTEADSLNYLFDLITPNNSFDAKLQLRDSR